MGLRSAVCGMGMRCCICCLAQLSNLYLARTPPRLGVAEAPLVSRQMPRMRIARRAAASTQPRWGLAMRLDNWQWAPATWALCDVTVSRWHTTRAGTVRTGRPRTVYQYTAGPVSLCWLQSRLAQLPRRPPAQSAAIRCAGFKVGRCVGCDNGTNECLRETKARCVSQVGTRLLRPRCTYGQAREQFQ